MDPQEFFRQKRDALIKDFEKFRAEPYRDSEGIPTIGYGTTSYPDGRAVTMSDPPVSMEQADGYFQHHINEFSDHISAAPGFNDLSHSQQAALTSFAYNTGPNVFTAPQGYETLQGAVQSGDSGQIADAMRLYNNGGNKGLIRRREAEIDLMNSAPPMPSNPALTITPKPGSTPTPNVDPHQGIWTP